LEPANSEKVSDLPVETSGSENAGAGVPAGIVSGKSAEEVAMIRIVGQMARRLQSTRREQSS
jgi:hypothetical protein